MSTPLSSTQIEELIEKIRSKKYAAVSAQYDAETTVRTLAFHIEKLEEILAQTKEREQFDAIVNYHTSTADSKLFISVAPVDVIMPTHVIKEALNRYHGIDLE